MIIAIFTLLNLIIHLKLKKMNLLKRIKLLAIALLISFTSLAQTKVQVEGLPLENGKLVSPQYMIQVSAKNGTASFDSRVWGNPGFFPGHVIAANGELLEGFVALLNKPDDPAWVKRYGLIVFEEDMETAYYIGPGEAIEYYQQKPKEEVYYDIYDNAYLERLVSGPAKLYYNPYFGSSGKVSNFLPPAVINQLRESAAKATVKQSLKDGKSVGQSLNQAMTNDEAVFALASSIQIAEKEYVLNFYGLSLLVTSNSYQGILSTIFKDCSIDESTLKSYSKNFKKIEEAIIYYNENCKKYD